MDMNAWIVLLFTLPFFVSLVRFATDMSYNCRKRDMLNRFLPLIPQRIIERKNFKNMLGLCKDGYTVNHKKEGVI